MSLKRINTPDQNLRFIQDNVDSALNPLQQIPMVNGNMLTGVILTSGQDNLVSHKLGRTPQFFIIAGQNANSTVWSPISSQLNNTSANSSYINLQCSSSCTINLWVN